MPIRPENRTRYPAHWQDIRERILMRAGNCCEWPGCSAPNGFHGYWEGEDFHYCPEGPSCFEGGSCRLSEIDPARVIRIVLTVAHLDHTPENCARDNLRAWCQRHHNRYDAKMRADGRRHRAAVAAGQGALL